jgi:uncharacterized protein (TIGR03663 family)
MNAPDRLVNRAAPWLLLMLAAGLRLPRLGLRPLHHDEGSNVIFLLRLLKEGAYRYDPSNYHGPLLYFLSAAPIRLFGASEITLRLIPALLGTLTALLPWFLRRQMGTVGAFAAGSLLALSPSLVYYSRDNIHEIYLVFLTLALVVAAVRGMESGRVGHWILAGIAAGGLVATKETAGLTFVALAVGLLSRGNVDLVPPSRRAAIAFLAAAGLVALVLYTDLFSDFGGLLRPIQAIRLWGARGLSADGHGKPWWYFLRILGREEPLILTTAIVGGILAVRMRDRFSRFLLGWTGAVLLAYSSIPYKTPWLVVNAVLPAALLGGTALGRGLTPPGTLRGLCRVLLGLVVATGVAFSALRAFELSFVRYDEDGASALIYVQTDRDVLRLVSSLEAFARERPEGLDVGVEILSPDYLPLNWYFRDFREVGYYGLVIEHPGAPAVIARSDSCDRVQDLLGTSYGRADYRLRPGVDLCLFLQEHPDTEEVGP